MPFVRRIDSPRNRLICIGDIHGCYDELSELMDRVAPGKGDVVVSTGDIVRKGPKPAACLEAWRDWGHLAVRGNNEEKILELSESRARRLLAPSTDREVARRDGLVEYIDALPVVIEFPALEVAIVHGGLYPGMSIEEKSVAKVAPDLVRLRWIRKSNGGWRRAGKTKERDDEVLWSEVWNGPATVVYGHTPLREPRVDRHAIGLDTGCVYGGWLTAAIYDGKWSFERVRARRQYAD